MIQASLLFPLVSRAEMMGEGNVAVKDQLMQVNKVEGDWLANNKLSYVPGTSELANGASLVKDLNKVLAEQKLPQIDAASPDLKIWVSSMNGFGGSMPGGFEIIDGKNKFCFPCTVGWNNFDWGLVPFAKSPRDSAGRYYGVLQCFEAIDKIHHGKKSQINSSNFPGVRFLPFVGEDSNRTGVFAVTDNSAYFYPVPELDDLDIENEATMFVRITLPNGSRTKLVLRGNKDEQEVYAQELTGKDFVDDYKDLGIGVGEKVTESTAAAIADEVKSQLEDAIFSDRSNNGKPKKIAAKGACEALRQCGSVEAFKSSKRAQKGFDTFEEEFQCSKGGVDEKRAAEPGEGVGSGATARYFVRFLQRRIRYIMFYAWVAKWLI